MCVLFSSCIFPFSFFPLQLQILKRTNTAFVLKADGFENGQLHVNLVLRTTEEDFKRSAVSLDLINDWSFGWQIKCQINLIKGFQESIGSVES